MLMHGHLRQAVTDNVAVAEQKTRSATVPFQRPVHLRPDAHTVVHRSAAAVVQQRPDVGQGFPHPSAE